MMGTRYYNNNAEMLCSQYDAIDASSVHRCWSEKHLPSKPGFACDIGAGSGRDANWLAAKGWDVVAVEPSAEMRRLAMARSHPNVTWLDDSLPHLNKLRALGHRFDLILLSAVWMHVLPTARERAFRIVSELLKPSGVLVLTRIAESAPGIVVNRTDDYVDIPLGMVWLYWLKQYKPLLLTHNIPTLPNPNLGAGFAKEDFYKLDRISSYDLRVGASFDAERGVIVTGAIRDACKNIAEMPARYTTYPGQNRPIFECQRSAVRKSEEPITLSKSYLLRFGTFRIPAQLWQTLGQYACWLEPAILREWSVLTQGWAIADYKATDMRLFEWEEGKRDTSIVAKRIIALRNEGLPISCVWSARKLSAPHIDHCFPWVRWLNNDLWNLLPASATVNGSKGDKLPSASAMHEAHGRIIDWWQHAYVGSPLGEKFLLEASSSLPKLVDGEPGLEDIYTAMLHQRARLKADQQLAEWTVR